MHYVVGNSLVCLTSMKARDIVYESRRADKGLDFSLFRFLFYLIIIIVVELNCFNLVITLDGTCFRKSGLITGGLASLESKAARWNEKKLAGKNKSYCCCL